LIFVLVLFKIWDNSPRQAGTPEMHQRRAEMAFKPVKPTSVHTEEEKTSAWDEYRAEQIAILERMARQRAARLSATALIRRKNGALSQ
jgi:hypothetical protein